MSSLLKFHKVTATGNDFIVLPTPSKPALIKQIPRLCSRRDGVGADGVVFVWSQSSRGKKTWIWDFYNSDGSAAGMCGNAARAVASYLVEVQKAPSRGLRWMSKDSGRTIQAQKLKKDFWSVSWEIPTQVFQEIPNSLLEDVSGFNDRGLAGVYWLQVGVPHLVLINYEVWNEQDRHTNSLSLRTHASLGREGANITWVNLKDFRAVTYERGVEKETPACGTGALAAALALEKCGQEQDTPQSWPMNLMFPGGLLTVSKKEAQVWISGAAKVVFAGQIRL